MPFVAGDDVNLVAFDRALKLRFGLEVDHAATQLRGHLMDVILVEVKFLGDLLVRQIEPHQVQAQDPFPQRLMVMSEDRIGQVVEIAVAGLAVIALSLPLSLMEAAPPNLVGLTPDAADALRPAELAHALITFRVVDQIVDSEHAGSMRRSVSLSKIVGLGRL
jgi:hypothetical protein